MPQYLVPFLLAFLIAKENKFNYLGIELPCWSKVQFDITSRYIHTVAVIHTECHFIQVSITIILSNSSPCMSEGIIAIIIFFLHTHICAYLSDANVYIGIKAVRITIPLMEVEQVNIIVI